MILGVTVVRNEADIIETMVRQNLHYLDHLVVIDNDSLDETPQIVKRLQSEGLACELRVDHRRNHVQHIILTEFLNNCESEFDVDRVILLDADEFIKSDLTAFSDEMLKSTEVIDLPWSTYAPTTSDDPNALSVLSRITHRRLVEDPQYFKTTVPKRYLRSAQLRAGSHGFKSKGRKIKGRASSTTKLAHFPVRTSEQLLGKVLLGSWNVRTRKHSSGEAYHWTSLAKQFSASPKISEDQLSEIARNYASNSTPELIRDPLEIHIDETRVAHIDAKAVLLEDIIRFAEELVTRFEQKRTLRKKTGDWIRTNVLRKPVKRS
jgi:hypothetical protein